MGMYINHLIDRAIRDTKPDRVAGWNPNLTLNDYVRWTRTVKSSVDAVYMLRKEVRNLLFQYNPMSLKIETGKRLAVKRQIGNIMFQIATICRNEDFDLEKIIGINMATKNSKDHST